MLQFEGAGSVRLERGSCKALGWAGIGEAPLGEREIRVALGQLGMGPGHHEIFSRLHLRPQPEQPPQNTPRQLEVRAGDESGNTAPHTAV